MLETKYIDLSVSIEKSIKKGLWKERLPSVRQLSKDLIADPATVSKAFKLLSEKGLVTIQGNRGTFVSNNFMKYKNLGLIMPALGADLTLTQSPTNYLIFDGIQKFCHENSWDIQIISKKNETFSLEKISKLNISGLIIVMPNKANYELIADLKKHQIPFLCINLHSEKINKDVNYINLDFYESTIDAVKYLYGKGRRNIGIVSTHKIREDSHISLVVEGYRKTIKELNLKENIIISDTEDVLPQELLPEFFSNNMGKIKKCDALITALSAGEATALLNIMRGEKINLPEEISLISFFENEESAREGITSYAPDLQALGYKSASLFNGILNDESKNIKQVKVKLRSTTRKSA